MASSFIPPTLKLIPFFSSDDMFAVRYVIIIVVSTSVCLLVTLLTKPVESSHLEKFITV
jgi:putative effector of murein hydrolase LrgA (UPF0299 family)